MLELTYFAARGTCDVIRLLLAEAGVSYQENIITGYDFAEIVDGVEFGSLPILVDENVRLVGPNTIYRYLGRKYNLFGSSSKEQAECDMWMEACNETLHKFWNSDFMTKDKHYTSNPLRLKFVDEYLVPKLSRFCQMLAVRESEFVVGNKFSCADICLFSLLDALVRELEIVVFSFAPLKDFYHEVMSRKKIRRFCDGPNRH